MQPACKYVKFKQRYSGGPVLGWLRGIRGLHGVLIRPHTAAKCPCSTIMMVTGVSIIRNVRYGLGPEIILVGNTESLLYAI